MEISPHVNLSRKRKIMTCIAVFITSDPSVGFWPAFIHSFIHSFTHFILPLTRNTTAVYRNTLKIIYNIPTKLFTRSNVVKARKPI